MVVLIANYSIAAGGSSSKDEDAAARLESVPVGQVSQEEGDSVTLWAISN